MIIEPEKNTNLKYTTNMYIIYISANQSFQKHSNPEQNKNLSKYLLTYTMNLSANESSKNIIIVTITVLIVIIIIFLKFMNDDCIQPIGEHNHHDRHVHFHLQAIGEPNHPSGMPLYVRSTLQVRGTQCVLHITQILFIVKLASSSSLSLFDAIIMVIFITLIS